MARRVMALTQGSQPGGRVKRKYAGDGKPRPKPNTLVSSFLGEIGPLFHDKNLNGSITRALRVVQGCGLEIDADILACLVRAYKVAKDTRTIREAHKNEDGSANKMPLFLAMLRTFAEACAQGKSQYSGEDLVADIAEDDRLGLWLAECGLQLEVLSDPAVAQSEELVEATITQDDDQEVTTTSEAGESEASFPQEEVSKQEQQSMQVVRRIRTAEDKQARADYARKVRAKLRKAGVSEMFAAMVDTEHPCGCPLFWDTENNWRWKCAHCKPHAGWSGEVREYFI